jgi:hypothetical protein
MGKVGRNEMQKSSSRCSGKFFARLHGPMREGQHPYAEALS